MTMKEFRKRLEEYPDDVQVVFSADPEGNGTIDQPAIIEFSDAIQISPLT